MKFLVHLMFLCLQVSVDWPEAIEISDKKTNESSKNEVYECVRGRQQAKLAPM